MAHSNKRQDLQVSSENPSDEVLLLADAVGKSPTTLMEVMRDFLAIVPRAIITGGFAMAHHGFVRATVGINTVTVGPTQPLIQQFITRGYKHETVQLPIGTMDLLTKGNKGVDFMHLKNDSFHKTILHRAVPGFFLKESVHFVSREDLILLKLMTVQGRKKKMDEVDLETLLLQVHDAKYVADWKIKLKINS